MSNMYCKNSITGAIYSISEEHYRTAMASGAKEASFMNIADRYTYTIPFADMEEITPSSVRGNYKAINIVWERDNLGNYPVEIPLPDGLTDEERDDYISDVSGYTFTGYELVFAEDVKKLNLYEVRLLGAATVYIDSEAYEDMDEDDMLNDLKQELETTDCGGFEAAELTDDEIDLDGGNLYPTISVTVEVLAKDVEDAQHIAMDMWDAIDCGMLDEVSYSDCEIQKKREKNIARDNTVELMDDIKVFESEKTHKLYAISTVDYDNAIKSGATEASFLDIEDKYRYTIPFTDMTEAHGFDISTLDVKARAMVSDTKLNTNELLAKVAADVKSKADKNKNIER